MHRPENQAWVEQLQAVASRTIRYHDMHQKIVIIDERVAWLGSLNTLSHSRTREIMLLHEGHQRPRWAVVEVGRLELPCLVVRACWPHAALMAESGC